MSAALIRLLRFLVSSPAEWPSRRILSSIRGYSSFLRDLKSADLKRSSLEPRMRMVLMVVSRSLGEIMSLDF